MVWCLVKYRDRCAVVWDVVGCGLTSAAPAVPLSHPTCPLLCCCYIYSSGSPHYDLASQITIVRSVTAKGVGRD